MVNNTLEVHLPRNEMFYIGSYKNLSENNPLPTSTGRSRSLPNLPEVHGSEYSEREETSISTDTESGSTVERVCYRPSLLNEKGPREDGPVR